MLALRLPYFNTVDFSSINFIGKTDIENPIRDVYYKRLIDSFISATGLDINVEIGQDRFSLKAYIENPASRRGTDFIFYSIAQNENAVSIVGGGDTLAAVSKKDHLDKITHISTGGGAMLELIEKGTLPGIEALKK